MLSSNSSLFRSQAVNNTLEKLRLYIETNNKLPSKEDKNKEIKQLGCWISDQKTKYSKQKDIMKQENIRIKWEDFINYGDFSSADVAYVAGTDTIDTIANVSNLYKYELKGTNSFDQVYNSSRENGTTFAEQTLTVTLKKQGKR